MRRNIRSEPAPGTAGPPGIIGLHIPRIAEAGVAPATEVSGHTQQLKQAVAAAALSPDFLPEPVARHRNLPQ